jgi:uncharacterized protein (TIGR02569 family)
MATAPPPPQIAAAFGVDGAAPCAVRGGQGATFRVGNLAVKKCEDVVQTEWLCGVMETVTERGFRIARPVRADGGQFVVDGWFATLWVEGTTDMAGRWHEAIDACQAFHIALNRVPWSPLLHRMDNPWGRADAAIWAQPPVDLHIGPIADGLHRRLRPIDLPSQLVHGDPGDGNFLFAPGRPPAIIDMPPYWHPADYAIAVLIADGIAWSGAPLSLLDHVAAWPQMDQLLLRAVLFRLYVGFLFRGGQSAADRRADAYAPVINAIENWGR